MNVQQLCEYLNEIGIIDMDNMKSFLNISTYMMNNNNNNQSNKSIKEIYKIALFSYIRELNKNDKNLFFTCSNIINSYKRFIILKKYNSLFIFKKLLYLKIYQRYKNFLISLYKKFPFKSYHTNKYQENKKKKKKSKTNINHYHNDNNNNNLKYEQNQENNKINELNYVSNINSNNLIVSKNQENSNEIKFENYKFVKELIPIKRLNKINNDICINQSNINFEKFFVNNKYILCKKNHNYLSYINRVKTNKKQLYSKNPYEYSYSSFTLRKNKSEKKLRIMKLNYEEKTRSKNFETLNSEVKRKILKRTKSKKDDEFFAQQKKDEKFNKLKEKAIDKNNLLDRLYRSPLIKKREEERKQNEEINKLKKSPIDWEKIYLETNDKIIRNNKELKMNKSCSYFMPKKGRIYKYSNTNESDNNIQNNLNTINNKDNKTIETSLNRDKEQSVKISLDFNSPNKNPNMISNNVFEIKESDLNSINSVKEENKSIEESKEKKEINENIKSSNISDDNYDYEKIKKKFDNNSSPKGLQSKGIRDLLEKKNLNKNLKNSKIRFNYSDNENENEIIKEENKEDIQNSGDKVDYNELLRSNNDTDNII